MLNPLDSRARLVDRDVLTARNGLSDAMARIDAACDLDGTTHDQIETLQHTRTPLQHAAALLRRCPALLGTLRVPEPQVQS